MKTEKTEKQINQLLAQRAAEWMETLKVGDRRDHKAFVEWLRESKLHVEHYLEMEALDREVESLDSDDRPDIDAILRDASASNVHTLEQTREKREEEEVPSPRRLWSLAAAVAGVTILGACGLLAYRSFFTPPVGVATTIGEQRILTLPDGSLVRMNVDTALQIHFSPHQRDIDLPSGEAVFEVAHDASRPFVVHTPSADVRAVGTRFNVYQRQSTVVSVLEGRVQVTTQPPDGAGSAEPELAMQSLGAGEEAQVEDGRIEKRAHPDVTKAVAWREGRLYFDEMPLEEIAREFNRHGGPVRVTVEGIPPGSYRFGGTFKASDPTSLADILEQQEDLIVERRPGEILIRPKSPAGQQQTN